VGRRNTNGRARGCNYEHGARGLLSNPVERWGEAGAWVWRGSLLKRPVNAAGLGQLSNWIPESPIGYFRGLSASADERNEDVMKYTPGVFKRFFLQRIRAYYCGYCESSVCEPGRHVAVATAVDTSSRAIILSGTGGPIICRNPIACSAHRPEVVSCRAGPQADTLCGCDWLMSDGDRRAVTRWRLCALPGLCEGVWPGGGCAWKAGSCRGLCAFPGL